MDPWLMVLAALWIYPIAALIVLNVTKNKLKLRKKIILFSGILFVLVTIAMYASIATVSTTLNWLLFTHGYFFCSVLLLWSLYQSRRWLKVIGIILMSPVFFIGYTSATVGILGVGFITSEYETDAKHVLNEEITCTEIGRGNALSDFRGRRFEVWKRISWFPFLEKKVTEKEYWGVIWLFNPTSIRYDKSRSSLYLKTREQVGKQFIGEKTTYWRDTIRID